MLDRHALRGRLFAIDEELKEISARAELLVRERQDVVQQLDAGVFGSDSHPIDRLPNEILAEIFMAVYHGDAVQPALRIGAADLHDDYSRPGSYFPHRVHLTLVPVCKRWRNVAHSLGCLWSTFDFRVVRKIHNVERTMTSWLPRAKACPLNIRVSADFWSGRGPRPRSRLMQLLSPFFARTTHLSTIIHLQSEFITTFPSNLIVGQFRQLRMLEVNGIGPDHGLQVALSPITGFSNAPNLRKVHLRGIDSPAWIVLPYEQLTCLRLSHVAAEPTCEFLRLTPNIEEVHLNEPSFTVRQLPLTRAFLLLPKLRILSIADSPGSMISDTILQDLSLPNLQSLALSGSYPEKPHFAQFLARSQCCIQSVDVEWIPDRPEGDVVELLYMTPTAGEIRIRAQIENPDELDVFGPFLLRLLQALEQNGDEFLPHLRSLAIDPMPLSAPFPYHALARMLLSRHQRVNPLQSFKLIIRSPGESGAEAPDQSALSSINNLKAGGMDVQLRGLQIFDTKLNAWAFRVPQI
ncbi:F-box domain-containing protein [Mycena chlorophos]|uniref:F-box domain-containing protein n=1 Tax=Mycena chlorophos TaxID=658473 RepID=A0A8H6TGM8_MYCCL|nr:F-box domain-containing protein [Mycena chlorophos]